MIVPVVLSPGRIENYFVQQTPLAFGAAPLANYQQHGPGCSATVRVQIFDELAESKKLALLLAHFEASHLNRAQVDGLIRSTIALYTVRSDWVQIFNERPAEFDYNSYLADFNKV